MYVMSQGRLKNPRVLSVSGYRSGYDLSPASTILRDVPSGTMFLCDDAVGSPDHLWASRLCVVPFLSIATRDLPTHYTLLAGAFADARHISHGHFLRAMSRLSILCLDPYFTSIVTSQQIHVSRLMSNRCDSYYAAACLAPAVLSVRTGRSTGLR